MCPFISLPPLIPLEQHSLADLLEPFVKRFHEHSENLVELSEVLSRCLDFLSHRSKKNNSNKHQAVPAIQTIQAEIITTSSANLASPLCIPFYRSDFLVSYEHATSQCYLKMSVLIGQRLRENIRMWL